MRLNKGFGLFNFSGDSLLDSIYPDNLNARYLELFFVSLQSWSYQRIFSYVYMFVCKDQQLLQT